MNFTLEDLDLYWVGTDDDTPAGCTLGHGYDPVGNRRLFLWRGDTPSDDTFLGSVLMGDRRMTAYGPRGSYAGGGASTADILNRLATA